MTIPNCISLFRIFLVPCFAWVLLTASLPEDFTLAAVLLVVSAVSDLLDGWIARRFHMTSKLGKILDPAADKLTLFGVYVCMWARYPGFWPLYSLFIAKELLMAAASVLILRRNHEIEASHWFGKLYTLVFYVVSVISVLDTRPVSLLRLGLWWGMSLFTIGCFALYIPVFVRQWQSQNDSEPLGQS